MLLLLVPFLSYQVWKKVENMSGRGGLTAIKRLMNEFKGNVTL